jgi:HK97 family phage portal protein
VALNILRKVYEAVVGNLRVVDPRFYRYVGGATESYSGQAVNADSALGLSAAYRCIRLISESVAMLPCKVYERRRDGTLAADTEHPLYMLLHDSPNAEQTAFELWESVGQSLAMWGNSYCLKGLQGDRVVSLTPIRPDMCRPYRRKDGKLWYKAHIDGAEHDLPRDKVWHVRGWGGGYNLVGASPIQLGRNGIGLGLAAERAASGIYANGLRPSGFVQVESVLKKQDRLDLKAYIDQYTGAANTGKFMVLEAGMKFQPLAIPPEDAQLLETRSFTVEEICRWFGVPPFLAFHTEKSTSWGTGLEQQQIGFLIFSLMPYLERIEQSINKFLIPPGERSRYTAEFAVEGILRADSAARSEFYQRMVLSGIFSPDEVRTLEGRPAMGGNSGKLWMPVNMALAAAGGATAANEPATNTERVQ